MMPKDDSYFHYVYSSDLRQRLKIRIGSLEGQIPEKSIEELLDDEISPFLNERYVYISVQLFSYGASFALPVFTQPIPVPKRYSTSCYKVKWDQWLYLPVQYCELPRDTVVALRLLEFGSDDCLGSTVFEVFSEVGEFIRGTRDLWVWPNIEPDPKYFRSKTTCKGQVDNTHQMHRLKPLKDNLNFKENSQVEWLNIWTTKEISQISHKESTVGDFMNLVVESQTFEYRERPQKAALHPQKVIDYSCVYMENTADKEVSVLTKQHIYKVPDFVVKENIVEEAHMKVARSIGRSITETKKPSPIERDKLMKIIQEGLPESDLENGTMVFKFHNFLSSYPNALIPFLTSIRWSELDEKTIALQALDDWAPIKAEAALGLLGNSIAGKQLEVRKYAVSRLRSAKTEDLELYLLQLVQALKYEEPQRDHSQTTSQLLQESMIDEGSLAITQPELTVCDGLESFLLEAAQMDKSIGSFLYWFIRVEAQNDANEDFRSLHSYDYNRFLEHFNKSFYKRRREKQRAELLRQEKLITDLINELRLVEKYSSRPERLEQFKSRLEDETIHEEYGAFSDFKPTMYPLDPRKSIVGINVEKTYLFKSAMMPALVFFKLEGGGEVGAILKVGDDLRQDQLILQMITLMNRLLLEEKLDLKLTPYSTLATSIDAGIMEFVPDSMGIGDILRKEGSIGKYLSKCHGQHVMDTYVRSCAGYCVITYILGVGDRHNDNLLITKDGRLFHVDFGFILGRDPKPMQPPLKLSREMVEAMGEDGWEDFKRYSYEAYINLRRHSQFILSLFALMLDAGIPDIAVEPDKTLQKLRERMRLDLTDVEAIKHFQFVIDQAISSITARISENMHAIKIWTTS